MKWFRIMTAGPTSDGREIKPEWLTQMAETYSQAKYGARIWLEHLRGIFADGPFKAYGDVIALKTEMVGGQLALFAQLSPLADLVTMVNSRQKIYTSAEVDTDFAKSGKAYLVGLGVTDSPASLGTDRLSFATEHQAGLFRAAPPAPGILLSDPIELPLTATDIAAPPAAPPTLKERIAGLFAKHQTLAAADLAAFRSDLEQTLALFVDMAAETKAAIGDRAPAADLAALRTDHAALVARFNALYTKLENTPDQPPRDPATGIPSGSYTRTDY